MPDNLHPLLCTCRRCDGPLGNHQHYIARRQRPHRRHRLAVAAGGIAAVTFLLVLACL